MSFLFWTWCRSATVNFSRVSLSLSCVIKHEISPNFIKKSQKLPTFYIPHVFIPAGVFPQCRADVKQHCWYILHTSIGTHRGHRRGIVPVLLPDTFGSSQLKGNPIIKIYIFYTYIILLCFINNAILLVHA